MSFNPFLSDTYPTTNRLQRSASTPVGATDSIYHYRLLMMGDAGVGKSALTIRFITGKFVPIYGWQACTPKQFQSLITFLCSSRIDPTIEDCTYRTPSVGSFLIVLYLCKGYKKLLELDGINRVVDVMGMSLPVPLC